MADENFKNIVQHEALLSGIILDAKQQVRLAIFLELLEKWGRKMNLTSTIDPEYVVQRHLRDAFELSSKSSEMFPSKITWADIGSGAGLTGLILAICRPELNMVLIEKNAKKCAFLRTAASELNLDIEVVQIKIENLKYTEFDVVVSRATWSPQKWVDIGKKIINKKGLIVCFASEKKPRLQLDEYLEIFFELKYILFDGTSRILIFIRFHP